MQNFYKGFFFFKCFLFDINVKAVLSCLLMLLFFGWKAKKLGQKALPNKLVVSWLIIAAILSLVCY
jgi:hypothetical protein